MNVIRRLQVLALMVALAGCSRPAANQVQGYVEGEYVYVASPFAGQLLKLDVQRGMTVKTGDPLFALECGAEQAQSDEAERKLAQARATLEDVKRGQRPSEILALEAQLEQAQAAVVLSDKEFDRMQKLVQTGASAVQESDRMRSTRDQNRKHVAQLEADLQTARLGSRSDQIDAAAANVRALEAALARADWDLAQKRQSAPVAGLVFDTLYERGEWVPAGRPVVQLLPPENVKVRAFVPEAALGGLRYGQTARVRIDGLAEPVAGTVSFISPRAEYTPPVIYSQESRGKLVFMVELRFDAATSATLHPGQPVDVDFAAP